MAKVDLQDDWLYRDVIRRKDRRRAAAEAIGELAREQGWTGLVAHGFDSQHTAIIEPRGSSVFIRRGGFQVCISFDGASHNDAWVIPWHVASNASVAYPDDFPGDVNPYHRRKSTCVAYSFGALKAHVAAALRCLTPLTKEG